MKPSQWFVGVDWASQAHQVCVLDEGGLSGTAQLPAQRFGPGPDGRLDPAADGDESGGRLGGD